MFERIEGLIGSEALLKIGQKSVLIIGLGGVGGSCVTALVRSGIQKLILVDSDCIELTNLNRQEIAFYDNIGKKKVLATKELVEKINPNCDVVVYDLFLQQENLQQIFDTHQLDYVIDACDTFATKQALIEECQKRKIKIISSMGTGNKMDPTKLEITDIRKTRHDPLARKMRKWVKDAGIKEKVTVISSTELPIKKDKKIHTMCFVPNVAGILIANYVICDIIKK